MRKCDHVVCDIIITTGKRKKKMKNMVDNKTINSNIVHIVRHNNTSEYVYVFIICLLEKIT